jgi:AraC family transcriptional regulator
MAHPRIIERVDTATGQRYSLVPETIRLSSSDLWSGIRLEHRCDLPDELSEGYFLRHVVALHLRAFDYDVYRPGHGWNSNHVPTWTIQLWPARMPLALRWNCCAEALLLEIAPELVAAAANGRFELRPNFEAQDRFISQAMLALEDDLRAGSPAGRLYGESLGAAIAAHLVRKFSDAKRLPDEAAPVSSALLRRILEYVRENLQADVSLHDLAQLAQIDEYRFSRWFKQSTGLPPHQYVLRQRIELAKSLLRNPAVPLAEVALRCGFGD